MQKSAILFTTAFTFLFLGLSLAHAQTVLPDSPEIMQKDRAQAASILWGCSLMAADHEDEFLCYLSARRKLQSSLGRLIRETCDGAATRLIGFFRVPCYRNGLTFLKNYTVPEKPAAREVYASGLTLNLCTIADSYEDRAICYTTALRSRGEIGALLLEECAELHEDGTAAMGRCLEKKLLRLLPQG